MTGQEKEWFDNKELYLMVQGLKEELSNTQKVVKRYNNLYESVGILKERLDALINQGVGKKSIEGAFLRWLPAIVAVLALILNYFK